MKVYILLFGEYESEVLAVFSTLEKAQAGQAAGENGWQHLDENERQWWNGLDLQKARYIDVYEVDVWEARA